MNESRRYLRSLRRALPRGQRRRVTAEIRAHLRDGIAAGTAGGLDRGEAERMVIERLGSPERLAAQFPTTEDRPMKPYWIAGGAVAAAVAAAVAVVSVTHTHHASRTPTVARASTAWVSPTMKGGRVTMVALPTGGQATAVRVVLRQVTALQTQQSR